MLPTLQDLRNQIDDVDQSIIQALSQSREGKDYLDSVSELTAEDKEALRGTRLRFSQRVCELLQKRMEISSDIGRLKRSEGRSTMIDEERRTQMMLSRIEWAPARLKQQVGELYEIIHDISVKIQL